MKTFTVSVFLCDKAWGGSEEGGWWYDYGTPAEEYLEFLKVFKRKSAAIKYMWHLNEVFAPIWNEGRREISSVLSDGQYFAEVCEGLPKAYPDRKPHYE